MTNQDTEYVYDSRNQLVQTTRGPPGAEILLGQYDYNAGCLRVRHRFSERGDVDYYYDDNAVIEEHNAADSSLLAHYRYADRLISLDTGTGTQYYHHDSLGSTVNLTTDAATVQVSYKLDPWGHIREQVGTSVNRQIYTGQEYDENTGLIYFGARFYDPDTARFLNQDSYLGEHAVPPSLHRYLYAYSNPLVFIDPNGNIAWIANLRDKLNDWPEEKYEAAGNLDSDGLGTVGAGLIGIGAGMGQLGSGALSTVNYVANWGSMVFGGTEEHAAELAQSHEVMGNVYNTLSTEQGRQQLSYAAFDTVGAVMEGDTEAIAKTTGFFGQIGAGGAVSKVTGGGLGKLGTAIKPKLAPVRQAVNSSIRKTSGQVAAKITKEVRDSSQTIKRRLLKSKSQDIDVEDVINEENIALSSREAIKASSASKKPDIVYRRLHQGERYTASAQGLSPRSPGANITSEQHILGARDTQYVSATRDYNTALNYNRNATPIVEIDLSKVPAKTIDFTKNSNLSTLTDKRAIYNATRDSEVLIQGHVPAEAIGKVHFP
ncbi:RHS repeat-associated core domain-containing protein [bacterium]|nr:RHS repeat-associated core domain-containing protein [bacterium]